jgi:hypothetical protein
VGDANIFDYFYAIIKHSFIAELIMSSVEVLSALCARAVRLQPQIRGSDNRVSGAEIAGYLSGLNEPETEYALAKYCGADTGIADKVRLHTASLAKRHAWKAQQNQINAMADIALVESISPCRCRRCGGVGFRLSRICNPCQGTGYKYFSAKVIAAEIQVPETTYRRVWSTRYIQVTDYLSALDSAVRARVSRNSTD